MVFYCSCLPFVTYQLFLRRCCWQRMTTRTSTYGTWTALRKGKQKCMYTAKTQCRKCETNIPRKGTVRPQSQFPHACVCEQFIYSHDRSAYSAAGKYVNRSWEYINRSQTHECGHWDWGRGILGIHQWDFRCNAVLLKLIKGVTISCNSPIIRA
jgi:hypothetical protein